MFCSTTTHHNNYADGGGIDLGYASMVMTYFANFTQNSARHHGGGLHLVNANFTTSLWAAFINNTAGENGGGIAALRNCIINFLGNIIFVKNFATALGGAIHASDGVIVSFLNSARLTHNSAREGGAVLIMESSRCVFQSIAVFVKNVAWYAGGSVSANSQSKIIFLYELNISESRADWAGGGIALTYAEMVIEGGAVMEGNEAGSFGGAVFADDSDIILCGNSLLSKNMGRYGGAIHAKDSKLDFSGSHSFLHNSAQFGGGWSFVGSASMTCSPSNILHFDSNYASKYGGAINIEDNSLYRCVNYGQYAVQDCFFTEDVLLDIKTVHDEVRCTVIHHNNSAILAGSIVYGGNVDNCKYNYFRSENFHITDLVKSGQVFDAMFHSVNESTLSSPVSSDPTRVCLCRQHNEPDCSVSHVSIEVFSGEQFGLSLVGVGQRNGTVPTVILAHSDPPSNQSVQTVGAKCSMVYYTLSTTVSHVKIEIYPESVCENYFSALSVSANIKPCPPGFEQNRDTKSCTCEATMEELGVQCDITSQSFSHEHGVWLGFSKQQLHFSQPQFNSSQSAKAPVLIFLHSHCPLDYCSNKNINFTHNSTDEQCRNGRQGLLCGACKTGYSLTLGGSRCSKCSYTYLLLFLVFTVAGVALVVLLLTLRFTVSAGTLNGLIFFVNIIGTNSTIFIPPEGASFLRVFIAWLNLDFGIHTCLFPGLDRYTKVWLQFAFPLYVWVLIGVIIVASHRSVLVTRWLGGDPVSVLATLILISYTKLLRAILTALSFTYLQVSDGSRFAVWLYDGNVQYLSVKHIPLFLFALLAFFLLFIPYTSVLLVSPHIQPYSRNRFLSWIDDRRLKHFLRSYYAPLKDKWRSWIGLLLAVRFFHLIIFLANSLGDPSVNLLAISITTFLIVGFKTLCGSVYTNWCLDALDLLFEIKLGLFSVSTLYVRNVNGNQSILSNVFLSVSFLVFSAIVLYHVQRCVVGSRWWKYSLKPKCKKCFSKDKGDCSMADGDVGEPCQEQNTHRLVEVPITFIALREPLLDSTCT